MRTAAPFRPDDLEALDAELLNRAVGVVSMRAVADGRTWPELIGLRHDVDNVIEPAVAFAEWEADRGYRSTYFALHTAPYWTDERLLRSSLDRIVELGHEVGLHNNAIAAGLLTGLPPRLILEEALQRLRGFGYDIRGTVAHGDNLCYQNGRLRFVNDEVFVECRRPDLGAETRLVGAVLLEPFSMLELDLDYDANWLPRAAYLSDSGGVWQLDGFDEVAAGFPYDGQLHALIHPDWWAEAFELEAVA